MHGWFIQKRKNDGTWELGFEMSQGHKRDAFDRRAEPWLKAVGHRILQQVQEALALKQQWRDRLLPAIPLRPPPLQSFQNS